MLFRTPRPVAMLFTMSLFCSCLMATQLKAAPVEATRPVLESEIDSLIEGLTSKKFTTRMNSRRALEKAGADAVEPLTVAATQSKLDVASQCVDLLAKLYESKDAKTKSAAKDALEKLSKSRNPSVAQRAQAAIEIPEELKKFAQLNRGRNRGNIRIVAGGNVQRIQVANRPKIVRNFKGKDDKREIEVKEIVGESITIKVTETKDGKKVTREIKVKNAAELLQKDRELYQLYVKSRAGARPQIMLNGNVINPAQGPIQIQVNGRNIVPAQGGFKKVESSSINGQRTTKVTENGRSIVIKDTNGQDIEVQITEESEGKKKTQTYKAKDLAELKKKHPEAAKIYAEYDKQAANPFAGRFPNGLLPGNALPIRPQQALPVVPAPPKVADPEAEKDYNQAREDLNQAVKKLSEYAKEGKVDPEKLQELTENIKKAQQQLHDALKKRG